MIAVAQILRLAGLPDDNCFTAPAAKLKKGRGKTSMVAVLSRRLIDASVLRD
jgi:hypothetical protein